MQRALAMVIATIGEDVAYDVQAMDEQDLTGGETSVMRWRDKPDEDFNYGWASFQWLEHTDDNDTADLRTTLEGYPWTA